MMRRSALRIFMVVILLAVSTGCSINIADDYPSEDSFELKLTLSQVDIKAEQEFEVRATFENKSSSNFEVLRSRNLILIQSYNTEANKITIDGVEGEVSLVLDGIDMPGTPDTIKGLAIYEESKKLKLERGIYKIIAAAPLQIKVKGEYKDYRIYAEPIMIEVK